jgi:hypothetical protein
MVFLEFGAQLVFEADEDQFGFGWCLRKASAAGMVTEGPWSPPMQSMEILIVICRDEPRLRIGGRQRVLRGGVPAGLSGKNDGAQHHGYATGINIAKEKAAPRTCHTLHRFHGTKQQDVDYSSFLVLRTLRPR